MAYTTINKSTDHFDTLLWTGNSTADSGTQNITGLNFQPDFMWNKTRSVAENHILTDVLRGTNSFVRSNSSASSYNPANCYQIPLSNGFTAQGDEGGEFNNTNFTYRTLNWKAGGAGSANTDGDINSTVSANTTSGFSIVKYTGNGSSGATVGHGLGKNVKMVIVKDLTNGQGWKVWHTGMTDGYTMSLNTTTAQNTDTNRIASANATTFTTSGTYSTNESGEDYIAYCFADIQGYSKFGSYTGNGSADGAFIYTGFKPAFILIKKTSGTGSWWMFDSKRLGYNPSNSRLYADSTASETTPFVIDFLSNGFKFTSNDGDLNASGGNYIFQAIAQAPLVGSNNVPPTAR